MTPAKLVLADKRYVGDDVRSSLLMHGILAVIGLMTQTAQSLFHTAAD
jgi:hypothetical protein